MALTGMSFKKQKWALARKQNRTLFRKRKPRRCSRSKVGCYSGSKKIDVILDIIKDAI